MKDWKKDAKYYSINIVFNKSLISYYNEKKEILNCETGKEVDEELAKSLKRLYQKDLNPDSNKNKHNKKLKINKDAKFLQQKDNSSGKKQPRKQIKLRGNK